MSPPPEVTPGLAVLHLEDSAHDAEILREQLAGAGLNARVDWASNEREFEDFLRRGEYDLVLADYQLPGFDAPAALARVSALRPGTPFICVSGAIGEDCAIDLLKRGATDYVRKDRLDRLPLAMRRALAEARERRGRHASEAALRESERLYRSLFENMLNGFAYCRMVFEDGKPRDFVYLAVNDAFATLTGLKDVVGKRVTEVIPGLRETDPELFEIYGRVAMTGQPQRFERYVEPLRMWFSISVYSPRSEHFVAVFDAITERKRAEAEKAKLEAQFHQAQKMESVGQLAGGVAHDFNNILAATMMHLSFLQQNPSFDLETRESLSELMEATKRAAALTRQLLIFSRRSVLEIKVLNLNEVVTNLLKMLGRLIGEHISFRFDLAEDLPPVEADPGMIEQVLMNLAVNARDAMPKGGRLTISTEPVHVDAERVREGLQAPGRFVCLSVADTGCGMDEATRRRLFEPFFTTKEPGKGTGLGLATVHGIVTQHQGWIEVETEAGKGTTFKVFFPATTKEMTESPPAGEKADVRGHETILLVEDEASLRQAVAQSLRLLGYRLIEATNGREAIQRWQEHGQEVDLLFSDMVMPEGLTGLDLAERLKGEKPGLKVLLSSGYNAEFAGQGRPAAAGITYLQKPYQVEVLSRTVRDCLDKK